MKRKKEIIIIFLVLIISVILVLIPIIKENNKEINVKTTLTTTNNKITITLYGEINYYDLIEDEIVNKLELEFKSGVSFGEIRRASMVYFTKYSYTDIDLTKRFFEDTKITVYSNCKTIEEDIDNTNKICINTASIDELTKLYGIGNKRANTIINYRKMKPFESFTELKNVLGISDGLIDQIKSEAFL